MEELQEERKAVAKAIRETPYRDREPIMAEDYPASSNSPRNICLEKVRECKIYVGIFKEKYGYIPEINNPEQLSVTALEYREARKHNLTILIFIDATYNSRRENRLEAFLSHICNFDSGHWRKQYSNTDELVNLVLRGIESDVTIIYNASGQKTQDIYSLPYFTDKLKEKLK